MLKTIKVVFVAVVLSAVMLTGTQVGANAIGANGGGDRSTVARARGHRLSNYTLREMETYAHWVLKVHPVFSHRKPPPRRHHAAANRWKHKAASYFLAAHKSLTAIAIPKREFAMFGWFSCAWAVGSFVLQYGLPIGDLYKWVKEAREVWGDVRGIMAAIRSGYSSPHFRRGRSIASGGASAATGMAAAYNFLYSLFMASRAVSLAMRVSIMDSARSRVSIVAGS